MRAITALVLTDKKMTDTVTEDIRERRHRQQLEEQIKDMITSLDVYSMIKEIDVLNRSSDNKMIAVKSLIKLRNTAR